MSTRSTNFTRTAASLLLLTACTWAIEIPALLAVWSGKILPPYGFFPNQSFDFLAKLRWAADSALSFAPALPDRFAGPAAGQQAAALAGLFPATLSIAVALALAGGCLAAMAGRREIPARRLVVAWSLLGLLVHAVDTLPGLGLDQGIRLSHLAYRARSLVVDGTAVAVLVWAASSVAALILAPRIVASRARGATLAAAMLVAAALGAAPSPTDGGATQMPSGGTSERRNVLLVSLDSLRADHVGAYGYERDTSPNFDRLAREGTLFRNALATSSWTLPTHLTMFTGRSQISHGVAEDTRILSTTIPTLGQIFQASGYATAGFVSGPYLAGHYGYQRGMDTYVDLSATYGKGPEARAAVLSPEINQRALEWLEANAGGERPFFLFLHYFDIHYDFAPPPPYDTMFDPDYTGTMDGRRFIERDDVHPGMDPRDLEHILALYDGEIRFTDAHVGAILDRLKEKGLMDDTVVMIVADHGDEFFEHGNKGHHRTVYDEVIRIPFALRLPDGTGAGRAIEEQVSLVDVLPTLLGGAGLAPLPTAEGENLVDWIEDAPGSREAVYAEFFDKRGFNLQVARRTPADKTIHHFNRITHPKRGAVEFYDLADDPDESDDRASTHTERASRSLETMSSWLDAQWQANRRSVREAGGRESIEIDEDTMERLKSLGYVGD